VSAKEQSFLKILSLRHYTVLLCIRLFESTAKTTSSATKAVAASSAMLPLVTARTVGFDRGFGGRISRGETHGRQAQFVTQKSISKKIHERARNEKVLLYLSGFKRQPTLLSTAGGN
jgi:hypothetical protein